MGKPFVMLPLDEDLASYFPDSSLSPQRLLANSRNLLWAEKGSSLPQLCQFLPGFLSRALESKAIPDSPATVPQPTISQLKEVGRPTEGCELPKPPSHISWAVINAAAWPSQLGKIQCRGGR